MQLSDFTERFINERRYLHNVSPATLEWFKFSFLAFEPVLELPVASSSDLKTAVIAHIRELQRQGRGNKAVSVNTQILKEAVKLNWLREEQKVIATFSEAHIRALINVKPKRFSDVRLHAQTTCRVIL